MNTSEIDPLLASEIARQKQVVINDSARWMRMFVAGSIASIGLGVGAWFLFLREPMSRDWEAACAVVFGAWFIGICVMLHACPNCSAPKCPKCGIDWVEEGLVWPTWKHCPGCGLNMNDDAGGEEKPPVRRNKPTRA